MPYIAVLTSGGDSPGMNAAVTAIARSAALLNMPLLGVDRGFNGLLGKNPKTDFMELNLEKALDIADLPGTQLRTARCVEFKDKAVQTRAAKLLRDMDVAGLIVIGGDGSFQGARALCEQGIPCIGIPGTIDNDIASTEYTIGFDTALNTAVQSIDKLRDTSQSHDRCSVVEVMGRNAGHLALYAGLATGAVATLIPERPFDLDRDVVDRMKATMTTGKHHFIVVVAEGVGNSKDMCYYIQQRTGVETRLTVLGHVQRGGDATAMERVYASAMGYRAIELLEEGVGSRIVGVKENRIYDIDIDEALAMKKDINELFYKVAREISI